MQLVIRPFCPSDQDAVQTLFILGTNEHTRLCFKKAMTNPLHIAVTLALCIIGYILASVLGAVVSTGVWVGLVYYCCYEFFASYVREKLKTDMQDIPEYYQKSPDNFFWVAEAEVDGRPQIMGMVAVVAKYSGKEKHGELCRLSVFNSCRRTGLGRRLSQTVIDFCKERGFSKVELETTSPQTAAVLLYKKLGFKEIHAHSETYVPSWVFLLTNVKIVKMEKLL